jgi:hypothetical protein
MRNGRSGKRGKPCLLAFVEVIGLSNFALTYLNQSKQRGGAMIRNDQGFIREEVLVISPEGFVQPLHEFFFWDRNPPPQADLAKEWNAAKEKNISKLLRMTHDQSAMAVIAFELADRVAKGVKP